MGIFFLRQLYKLSDHKLNLNKNMKTLWAIILIFVLTDNLTGQNTRKNTFPIRITVCDSINHELLNVAAVSV